MIIIPQINSLGLVALITLCLRIWSGIDGGRRQAIYMVPSACVGLACVSGLWMEQVSQFPNPEGELLVKISKPELDLYLIIWNIDDMLII
jgi:hypothetical protein